MKEGELFKERANEAKQYYEMALEYARKAEIYRDQ